MKNLIKRKYNTYLLVERTIELGGGHASLGKKYYVKAEREIVETPRGQ